jgi:beta-barrel assembly-enhancing protease
MLSRFFTCVALTLSLSAVVMAQTDNADTPTVDPKHQKEIDSDTEQGKKYSEEVEKQYKVSKDEAMQERVKRVGADMAAIANRTRLETTWGDRRFSKFEYSFKVLEGKDNVNAFSLPGGRIYVYEGLMNFIQTDDELAAVLGHEISHAAMRHVAQLQRDAGKVQALEIPLILAAILRGGQGGSTALQTLMLGNQTIASGWSIKAEKAADLGGFQLMQKSGYNSSACLTVVERLAQLERAKPELSMDWGIYRTHPPSEERVAAILKDFKSANVTVQRSAVTTSFTTQLKKVDGGVEAWFGGKLLYTFSGENAGDRAASAEKRLNSFFDKIPNLYDVQVQGDRVLSGTKLLIEVQSQDAEHAKTSVGQLASKTLNSIRSAIYSLTFQVWQPTIQ